jgi:shikimate kinase
MVITLIGYRGSGKSSVAAPLARQLGWDWVDADVEIERRAGRTIREIFAADGELRFRQLEREIIAELAARDRLVIAAGGGAVLNADNRRDLRAAGPVVWLQADPERLSERIAGDATTSERRPKLTAQGGTDEIRQVLAERAPLYRQCATVTVNTDALGVDEVVAAVRQAVDPWLQGRP